MNLLTTMTPRFQFYVLLATQLLMLLAISPSVIAQEEAPFTDNPSVPRPIVTQTPPPGTPPTTPQPPTIVDQQNEEPPFKDPEGTEDPSKQEGAPFVDPPSPKSELPFGGSDIRSPRPMAELTTVELEIAEVKRLAGEELIRLRNRGQYATSLVSSRLSQVREENLGILRESVAIAKNMVVGRRLSLSAFVQIQSECIHAELAVALTQSMRSSVLRKAIDACNYIEEKVKGMDGPGSMHSAPLFTPTEIHLITIQREHWEQLLNGGSVSTNSSSSYPIQQVQSSAPSSPVYCRPTRRRR